MAYDVTFELLNLSVPMNSMPNSAYVYVLCCYRNFFRWI